MYKANTMWQNFISTLLYKLGEAKGALIWEGEGEGRLFEIFADRNALTRRGRLFEGFITVFVSEVLTCTWRQYEKLAAVVRVLRNTQNPEIV